MKRAVFLSGLILLFLAACQSGSSLVREQYPIDNWVAVCDPDDAWNRPGPPFHIYGNTYYVGTCGITAILIAGSEGHILIDGGPRDGGPLVSANIEALGFDLSEVRYLAHTQEHFDHVGGLAYLQDVTGAQVVASHIAGPVLESGEISMADPQYGLHNPFAPVSVSRHISEGETLSLGNLELMPLQTPGHAPGALSWTWQSCESEVCLSIAYFDSMTPISSDDYQFTDHPEYLADFYASLDKIRTMPCDIAMTPHPAMSALFERILQGPGLIDDRECGLYIDDIKQMLDDRIARERAE